MVLTYTDSATLAALSQRNERHMTPIAVLGAGKMGAALVDRWAEAGREVVVWNRTLETAQRLERPGVTAIESLDAAVAGANVVVSMLTDGHALRAVLLDSGIVSSMQRGTLLVDLSTIDVATSADVAIACEIAGVQYVRGAVSGTPPVVRSGSASLLLSAEPQALDAARPYLAEITSSLIVLGTREESRVVKIAINGMLAGTMQLLAEATLLAEASGVSRETFLAALDGSVLGSRFISYKGAALIEENFAPTFTTRDMAKDVSLALDQATSVGIKTPAALLVREQLDAVIDAGNGSLDFASLFTLLQENSG
jgi:2-hydroxy-3-oxopropionate reductase